MKLYYADHFVLPLPQGHRFPMEKYAQLRARLARSTAFSPADFVVPAALENPLLTLAHAPDYVARVVGGALSTDEQRRIGFPWSSAMVERSRRSAGATLEACRTAMREGCAANLAGGTHHAHRDFGSGFCVFNDAAIAALAVRAECLATRIAVIDCDVHQGDGTASILENEPDIFTFSMHAERNFPFRKAHSDLDIALPDGCRDAYYLERLAGALREVLDHVRPQLVIYLAGADPYAGDRLGRLSLTIDGLVRRDRLVFERCREYGAAIAIAMAGGYAGEIADTVTIHTNTILTAAGLHPHTGTGNAS